MSLCTEKKGLAWTSSAYHYIAPATKQLEDWYFCRLQPNDAPEAEDADLLPRCLFLSDQVNYLYWDC